MSSFINFKNCIPMVANSPLTEQSSRYALTFDELQNASSGSGKDFGSMNMDELLKNIWTPEETQSMTSNSNLEINGNLQMRGSLTLPRTVSQKKGDEDLRNENGGFKDVDFIKKKQQTFGEMTLEEFLQRAGAVSGNNQTQGSKNAIQIQGFYQEAKFTEGKNEFDKFQGVRSSKVPKFQKILPKEANNFKSSVNLVNNAQMGRLENRVFMMGKVDRPIKTDYPSDLYKNNNFDTSPPPPLEKVVERRRKRMIKNRESAARSRARKQAYTLELEAEVEKLKEEVQKKQEELMESQNFQIMEKMKLCGSGRLCLRRTVTGPW